MARTLTVTLTSDKSGAQIPAGTGGRVRILFYDENRVDMRADLTDKELKSLIDEYGLKEVEPRTERRKRLTL